MEEAKIVAEKRASLMKALKADFIRQAYNPYRYMKHEPLYDPAVERHLAMRTYQYDHFRPSPKNIKVGLFHIVPLMLLYTVIHYTRENTEKTYRTGQVSYRDRKYKFL